MVISLLVLAGACVEQPNSQSFVTAPVFREVKGQLMDADTLKPPSRVKAGRPIITPAAKGHTLQLKAHLGEAGGYTFLQNYTTDNGLAMDAATLGQKVCLCDHLGNMWFATNGGGVSRYDGKSFSNFTQAHGLPNNTVYGVAEASNGDLWFVTYGVGMCKYDGYRFTQYTTEQGLVSNNVLCCTIDKTGKIWLGTNGSGLCYYDGRSFTAVGIEKGSLRNTVMSLATDSAGNLWVGSYKGVSLYNGKVFTDFTSKQGLAAGAVLSIAQDKRGRMWFGTEGGGVSSYDGKTFRTYTNADGLIGNVVFGIAEDKSGDLWFGTQAGLSRFDGKVFTNFTHEQGLSNDMIINVTPDKTGCLWLHTYGGGVDRYDGKAFTSFGRIPGLVRNIVTSIEEDKYQNMWFGTYTGGVFRYNGSSFVNYDVEHGLAGHNVYSIFEDKKGQLWFGTGYNGLSCYNGRTFVNYNKEHGLISNDVRAILQDSADNLWVGTFHGLSRFDGETFINYDNRQGLAGSSINCCVKDRKGQLWIGTNGGGVSCFNGKTFINYSLRQGKETYDVLAITEDSNGFLWFATSGWGLVRFDGTSFLYFTTEQGLPDNTVTQVLFTKNNQLMAGTNLGLAVAAAFQKQSATATAGNTVAVLNRLTNRELSEYQILFENYNSVTGYPVKDVNGGDRCMFEDSRGLIWLANGSDKVGLMRLEYDAVLRNPNPPQVLIQGLRLNEKIMSWHSLEAAKSDSVTMRQQEAKVYGKPLLEKERNDIRAFYADVIFDSISRFYPVPKHLVLPYKHNHISFDFAAVEPVKPYLLRYQYMLEGYDKDWSPVTTKTSVSFGNMNEGIYVFKLKARSPYGVWSEPLTYRFQVLPPWWRTWWMYLIYTALSLSTVIGIVWYNGQVLRARAKDLKFKVDEATQEIKDQKRHLEEKHKEITDSINYAERIQRSLLASTQVLEAHLNEYFIFYKPKAVVSGDFYWAATTSSANEKQLLLCVADSTGHGVPGAIMSILNIACLEKAIEVEQLVMPDEILNHTRRKVIETLKKDGSSDGGRDGMDGCLMRVDVVNMVMHCSLANVPVWIIRDHKLIEIKRDRYPVGKHERDQEPFTLHRVELQKGDLVYSVTDGYADQFGGPFGKKFKYKQLQEVLFSIAHEPMVQQKQKLFEIFEKWRGNLEQVDDVTIFGFRV